MNGNNRRKNWLLAAATSIVFGGAVASIFLTSEATQAVNTTAAPTAIREVTKRNWSMFGGTVARNLVNLVEKNVPAEWSTEAGKEQNIRWSVELGSKAYGGPIISNGKIFIGTNNDKPRDAKVTGDKGILMCLDEATGQLLWQAVHDKLPAGRVNDWPREGICSSPVVEGEKLYYISNRCEVICGMWMDSRTATRVSRTKSTQLPVMPMFFGALT